MRKITLIIIHCSAVRPGQTSSAQQIDDWHRQQGYRYGIGYHYVVRRDGTIEPGRPEHIVGAHCKNHNKYSIGICYEGGLDAHGNPADTRTPEQKTTLLHLLKQLKSRYPRALILGHNTFAAKACPCFDAAKEYADLLLRQHTSTTATSLTEAAIQSSSKTRKQSIDSGSSATRSASPSETPSPTRSASPRLSKSNTSHLGSSPLPS